MKSYSDQELALIREFNRLEAALSDMRSFREFFSTTELPDWRHSPVLHHLKMMEYFERWMDTPNSKLMIFLPFGSGKSVYASVQLPLFLWARDPTLNILSASNTQDFAESLARRRRDAVETQEFARLSGATLRADSKSVREFSNTKGGIMRASGVGASVTGYRADYTILDDPHSTFEQLESRKYRDELYSWYRGIFRSRLSPGGCELLVTTRYSDDDLAGRLLREEEGDWEILRIPEVADETPDILGREIGQRLWPEFLHEDRLLNRTRDSRLWLGSYQSRPPAESGSWLDFTDLPVVPHAPKVVNVYLAVDLALSVGKGDWSVIMTAGLDEKRDLYILDVWRKQVSTDEVAKELVHTCAQYTPVMALIDDDNASRVFTTYCNEAFRQQDIFVPLRPVPTRGQEKQIRASAIRGFARQGRVKLVKGDWNSVVLEEATGFPDVARHDDAVDCLSLLGRELAKMSGGTAAPPRKPRELKTQIQAVDNKPFTTQTLDELWDSQPTRSGIIRL